jgi:hypothetical protein
VHEGKRQRFAPGRRIGYTRLGNTLLPQSQYPAAQEQLEKGVFTGDVLTALGQMAEADRVLTPAAQLTQAHLDKNSDQDLQGMSRRQPTTGPYGPPGPKTRINERPLPIDN